METKNLQTNFVLNRDQQTKQIKSVLKFIQKTMEALSIYEKQFLGQLDKEMTRAEM